ncbi:MAG: DUF1800 domain-containing protein [Rhodothermales bacterium]
MNRRRFLTLSPTAAPSSPAPPQPIASPPAVRGGLEPYTPSESAPWDERRAAHLVRRLAFGASVPDLTEALFRTPSQAVDYFVDQALARPLPDTPTWYNSTPNGGQQNIDWLYAWQEGWYAEMRAGGLREKMTLFWHDHFATEVNVYGLAPYAYQYLTHLRTHALGNFRTLLSGVGTLPAMLIYLDGNSNTAGDPNENYARELYELFTMGIGNYEQEDVSETARALTGWRVNAGTLSSSFDPARHDGGQKTIFGQTGAWGYADVLDLVFAQRGAITAQRLCRKLYEWFVYGVPNDSVVQGMAATLVANDWNVAPVLRQLFKSAHFFDDAFIGAQLKDPSDFLIGLVRELGLTPSAEMWSTYRELGFTLGQELLNPPNVAGWDGYRTWITTGSVPERQIVTASALFGGGPFDAYDPLPLIEQITDPTNVYSVAGDLADFLLTATFDEEERAFHVEILLAGAPYYEWPLLVQTSPETAKERLRNLLNHLVTLPEFQLT